MHLDRVRIAALAFCWLTACETSRRAVPPAGVEGAASQTAPGDGPLLAGGETSEFSGGDVAYGYCPVVASHTELDLARPDLASWVALAQGHHEIPLRWRRAFPDDALRGFEERTHLLLDVEVLGAEDVSCRAPPEETGYETLGYRAELRRFILAVTFSTDDGALHGSFQSSFLTTTTAAAEPALAGGASLPLQDVASTLELGVADLQTQSLELRLELVFSEQGAWGVLSPWVTLPGPQGARANWSPIQATFPAPDPGCEQGTSVPLDDTLGELGDTPRALYDLARWQLPAEPMRAALEDFTHYPSSFRWTEISVSAGEATHACRTAANAVDVYTSLRLQIADGSPAMDWPAIAQVSLAPGCAAQARAAASLELRTLDLWLPAASFALTAGLPDLDLNLAQKAALRVRQTFDIARGTAQGEGGPVKWVNYANILETSPRLHWCAGPECDYYWCTLAHAGDDSSCQALPGAPTL